MNHKKIVTVELTSAEIRNLPLSKLYDQYLIRSKENSSDVNLYENELKLRVRNSRADEVTISGMYEGIREAYEQSRDRCTDYGKTSKIKQSMDLLADILGYDTY